MIHPITFSIPAEKITVEVPWPKTKLISDLIPGNASTYIYKTEAEYYNEYKQSLFAKTTKKGGWDCMRHYEIIACGAIPYFPDIEKCPSDTMALLPKNLIIQGNNLYRKYQGRDINELDEMELEECKHLIKKLLDYTHSNLTTYCVAKHILTKTDLESAKNVLYLSEDLRPDYLRCLTLHGFKSLLGNKCHDYPKVPHIYRDSKINYGGLYGRGITYSNLLELEFHDDSLDASLTDDIINGKYDVIIYGSCHRGMPFYDLVSQHYPPERVILLCGEDLDVGNTLHRCKYKSFSDEKGHPIFIRELNRR